MAYDPLANMTSVIEEELGILPDGTEEPDTIDVSLDDEENTAPGDELAYDENSDNIALELSKSERGKQTLAKIGAQVCEDFRQARDGSQRYVDEYIRMLQFLSCDLPAKKGVLSDAANCNVPIILENLGRLVMRIYDEVVGNWSQVYTVQALGKDDALARIRTRHGNWELRNTIPEFPRQLRRAITCFLLGDVRAHVWYDAVNRCKRFEVLTPDQLFVPFEHTTVTSDFSDCPYIVQLLYMQDHELEDYTEIWAGVEKVLKGKASWDDNTEVDADETMARVEGTEKPENDDHAPHAVLAWEGWMMLPNQKKQRFVRALVHLETESVLQLTVWEKPDWRDKARYDAEIEQGRRWQEAMTAYRTAAAEQQSMAETALAVGGQAPPPPPEPPPAPEWMSSGQEPRAPRMVPQHNYVHGVCSEPIKGQGGLGFGRILADYQRAANTALSQFQDSATAGNMQAFMTNQPSTVVPDQIGLAHGRVFRFLNKTREELEGCLMPIQGKMANPQLFEVLKFCKESAEKVVQSPSVLSGDPGKSGETFRGLAARIEQATKNYSVAAGIFCSEFLAPVFRLFAYLNSLWLPESELVYMSDDTGDTADPVEIRREMYERNYSIEVRAELRFTTQAQKVAEDNELIQLSTSVPVLAQNPAFQLAVIAKALKNRGHADLVPLLQMPAPPPVPPPGAQQGGPPGASQGAPPQAAKPPGPPDGIPGRPPGG